MKTYELFIEATEADLKSMGASASQIAMLKKRQEKRGKGFSTGDDRVSKTPSSSAPKGVPMSQSSAPKTRSIPPSSALVKRSAADKATAMVRQKQGGTGKEAIGAPKTGNRTGTKTYSNLKRNNTSQSNKPYSNDGAKAVKRKPIDKGSAIKKFDPGKALRDKVAKKDNAAKMKALKSVGNTAKNVAKSAFNKGKRMAVDGFRDSVRMTSKAGPGVADSKDLKGPMKGIYGASSKAK